MEASVNERPAEVGEEVTVAELHACAGKPREMASLLEDTFRDLGSTALDIIKLDPENPVYKVLSERLNR